MHCGVPLDNETYEKYKDYFDTSLLIPHSEHGLVNSYMRRMINSARIEQLTVCIVGSGNWGSTAAKIIGENVLEGQAKQFFNQEVRMWVFEEEVDVLFQNPGRESRARRRAILRRARSRLHRRRSLQMEVFSRIKCFFEIHGLVKLDFV